MATITIQVTNTDGTKAHKQIEAKRFQYTVEGEAHWFAYHQNHAGTNEWVVTHVASGMRMCALDYMARFSCLGDDKEAARLSLDKLVARVGAARVRSVLAGAPTLKKGA